MPVSSSCSSRPGKIAASVLVLAGGAWLLAGPLNPPAGPVSAGGKSTQEIYDAVTGISGSIGAVGGRGPAVPGGNTGAGTIVMAGGQPLSSTIIGMRLHAAASVPTGGGGSGVTRMQGSGVTVVRALSNGSTAAWRMAVNGQASATATITVPSAGGNTVYVLSNVTILGYRDYLVQRADDTFGAIEELDLWPIEVRVTEPSGATWRWNFATNSGGV